MKVLLDYNLTELRSVVAELGEKPFRGNQIYSNLVAGKSVSEMTDISKALKDKLLSVYADEPCKIIKELVSKDGTKKFLFALSDGNVIEGVLMKYKYGNTLCVSTQVGCRMGCKFCASTLGGLVRNLSAGEILSEVIAVNRHEGGTDKKRAVTNVVLMGSGEPLDNYDNVVKFIRLLSDENSLNVSPRNVSLSTCGLVPKMLSLADENLPINLTVSLHNPFDEKRKEIMPVANSYTVKEIIEACENYFLKTGRRYYFEYSLISGQNDTDECLAELLRILKGKPCHVNLIRLNSVKEKNLIGTNEKRAFEFMNKLNDGGVSATMRRRMGVDIDGACGQLRRSFLGGEN